nr:hypothetical protein [Chloroflexus sp.]
MENLIDLPSGLGGKTRTTRRCVYQKESNLTGFGQETVVGAEFDRINIKVVAGR